jgi:hypothetical protein
MLVDPQLDEIVNGERGMLRGIDACMSAQCLVSAVSLMYSAIDSVAALARDETKVENDSRDFIDWVEKYLDPRNGLGCTSRDLWAARCAILHTYGFESHEVRAGTAKALFYAWQDGPRPPSAKIPGNAIILVMERLREELGAALGRFLNDAEVDRKLKSRVEHNRHTLLCYKPWSAITVHVAA